MSTKMSLKMAFRKNLYPDITFFMAWDNTIAKVAANYTLLPCCLQKAPHLNWLEVEKVNGESYNHQW